MLCFIQLFVYTIGTIVLKFIIKSKIEYVFEKWKKKITVVLNL